MYDLHECSYEGEYHVESFRSVREANKHVMHLLKSYDGLKFLYLKGEIWFIARNEITGRQVRL